MKYEISFINETPAHIITNNTTDYNNRKLYSLINDTNTKYAVLQDSKNSDFKNGIIARHILYNRFNVQQFYSKEYIKSMIDDYELYNLMTLDLLFVLGIELKNLLNYNLAFEQLYIDNINRIIEENNIEFLFKIHFDANDITKYNMLYYMKQYIKEYSVLLCNGSLQINYGSHVTFQSIKLSNTNSLNCVLKIAK